MADTAPWQLHTIKFSHFCEKARWVLDRFGISYQEHTYVPLLHMPQMFLATKGITVKNSRTSTPMLVIDKSTTFTDSCDISRAVSDRFTTATDTLYPSEEVGAFETRLGERFGPAVRRCCYYHILQNLALFQDLLKSNFTGTQMWIACKIAPIIRAGIRKGLNINKDAMERSLKVTQDFFAEVSERLSDGRQYLFADRFTAADLTFAALAAPVLCIQPEEGMGCKYPTSDQIDSAEFRAVIEQLRTSPAGQHALRMFREERRKQQIAKL